MIRLLSVFAAVIFGVAVASPATPTDADTVTVCVEIDTPISEVRYGEPIVLQCVVNGMHVPYTIQWQSSADREVWNDVPCNEEVYEFILDEQNSKVFYRVAIRAE